MLALTDDPRVADALELATLNAWAGAQHPSGRWCAYNTPMDGVREASAHTIVFQSRAGTPELNCCSVNGPRGWGMLAEWAVMTTTNGVVLNWLGPLAATVTLPDQSRLTLRVTGDYPWQLETHIALEPEREQHVTLHIHVPAWSTISSATCNNQPLPPPAPGSYLTINRAWRKGDRVSLKLDPRLRAVAGAQEARGCVSLYRGPILLAWDQRLHEFDEDSLPPVDLPRLREARAVPAGGPVASDWRKQLEPRLLVHLPSCTGPTLHLCDFASAGATGTRYRTWLRAQPSLPPPVVTRTPRDGARIAGGKVAFRWTRAARADESDIAQTLRISPTEDLKTPTLELPDLRATQTLVDIAARFEPGRWYYWDIVTASAAGQTPSPGPPARFRIDSELPPAHETLDPPHPVGPRGERLSAALRGHPAPQFGHWQPSAGWKPAPGPDGATDGSVALDGNSERLIYTLGGWPEDDYSLSIWFRIRSLPSGRIGQIFSVRTLCIAGGLGLGPTASPHHRFAFSHGPLAVHAHASHSGTRPRLGERRNLFRRQRAVKHGDLVKAPFPVEMIVATPAQEQPIRRTSPTGLGGRLDLRLGAPVQVDPHRRAIANENRVVPGPSLDFGPAAQHRTAVGLVPAREDQPRGRSRRAANAKVIALPETMIRPPRDQPTRHRLSLRRHPIPEPEGHGIPIAQTRKPCLQAPAREVSRTIHFAAGAEGVVARAIEEEHDTRFVEGIAMMAGCVDRPRPGKLVEPPIGDRSGIEHRPGRRPTGLLERTARSPGNALEKLQRRLRDLGLGVNLESG